MILSIQPFIFLTVCYLLSTTSYCDLEVVLWEHTCVKCHTVLNFTFAFAELLSVSIEPCLCVCIRFFALSLQLRTKVTASIRASHVHRLYVEDTELVPLWRCIRFHICFSTTWPLLGEPVGFPLNVEWVPSRYNNCNGWAIEVLLMRYNLICLRYMCNIMRINRLQLESVSDKVVIEWVIVFLHFR